MNPDPLDVQLVEDALAAVEAHRPKPRSKDRRLWVDVVTIVLAFLLGFCAGWVLR